MSIIIYKPAQMLFCEFGPDPRAIQPPGIMRGPLSVFPEMFKVRPVVVLSAGPSTTIVVPFSTVAPNKVMPFHYRIPAGTYGFLSQTDDSWLKADLMAGVSMSRLTRPKVAGKYSTVYLKPVDYREVRIAVLKALRFGDLVPHLQ
jgi:uncharacterized protein YifN (PemK superfamily)